MHGISVFAATVSGPTDDLTQLVAGVESAQKGLAQPHLGKARLDSQGSLPKTASNTYLNENSTEL